MSKENKNFIDADKTFKLAFNYDPERLNRFLVRFPGEMELMEWLVSTFKKPSYDLVNKRWDGPAKCRIRYVVPSDAKKWHPFMKDSEIIENFNEFNDKHYKYIGFEELDPTGRAIHSTKYTNPKFTKIDFKEYDYNDDGFKEYEIEIGFDDVIEDF